MAKTQTQGTLSPSAFATGAAIYADDAQAVAEALNWAFGYVPATHVSLNIGDSAPWDIQSLAPHGMLFPATGTLTDEYAGHIWIDPDVVSILVGAHCRFDGSDEGDVTFEIGGDSVTLSFDAGDTTEKTASLATADTGTGWQEFTITIAKTVGTDPGNAVLAIRIEDEPVTSGLPSPVDE